MKTITLDGQKIRVFEKGDKIYWASRDENGILQFDTKALIVNRYNIEIPKNAKVHVRYWFRWHGQESWTDWNNGIMLSESEVKRLEEIKQRAMKKLEATKKRLTKTEQYILGY